MEQKQYQVSCSCGGYSFIKKKKPNEDKYACTSCKETFSIRDKDRNKYVMRGREVFKKNG